MSISMRIFVTVNELVSSIILLERDYSFAAAPRPHHAHRGPTLFPSRVRVLEYLAEKARRDGTGRVGTGRASSLITWRSHDCLVVAGQRWRAETGLWKEEICRAYIPTNRHAMSVI